MISPEKEKVPFTKSIDVNEGDKKGNVEKWLLEIEHEMRNTLKTISMQAISDTSARNEWVLKYPAMVTLMGDMNKWTIDTEKTLNSSLDNPDIVKKYAQKLFDELQDIVQLVRGDLSELDRMTLGALVCII